MKELLEWIKPSNEDQAHWLKNYIYKKKEIRTMNELIHRLSNTNNTEDKIKEFKEAAINWPNTAETRELCRQMKSAWNQKKKRKNSPLKNGEFSISQIAYNELKRRAKEEKMSLSKVIESALLGLDEARSENKQVKKLQKSLDLKEKELNRLSNIYKDKNRTLGNHENEFKARQEDLNHRINELELKEADLAKRITIHEMNVIQ